MDPIFKEKGFKIVKDFYDVTSHTLKNPNLYHYLLNSKHLAVMDVQVPHAEAFYNNVELCKMHSKILSKMEVETGLKLYPTYVYARIYNPKSILAKHVDRASCEISITVNIGHDGEYSWPICIKDFSGNDHSVTLGPGDGLIYHGCELLHWREPADHRVKNHAQAFLHFVKQDGQLENYIYDNPYRNDSSPKKEEGFLKGLFKIFK